jgi:hypothetical protein
MKPPACDPGDFCMAQRAESTLFMPEIAKSAGSPKRFQHVSPFRVSRSLHGEFELAIMIDVVTEEMHGSD